MKLLIGSTCSKNRLVDCTLCNKQNRDTWTKYERIGTLEDCIITTTTYEPESSPEVTFQIEFKDNIVYDSIFLETVSGQYSMCSITISVQA